MAIFSKKSEDKTDNQVTVKTDTAKAGSVPEIKIPTVLDQPRISEKARQLAKLNKYVFKVLKGANKVEVKKAVETFYKVHVVRVNIVNNLGKNRNFGNRTGITSAFKKAVVTLKRGDKIEGLTD